MIGIDHRVATLRDSHLSDSLRRISLSPVAGTRRRRGPPWTAAPPHKLPGTMEDIRLQSKPIFYEIIYDVSLSVRHEAARTVESKSKCAIENDLISQIVSLGRYACPLRPEASDRRSQAGLESSCCCLFAWLCRRVSH